MPSTVDSLYQAGVDLLAACVDALNLTPAGAPTISYVAGGQVALDGDQLTVHFESIRNADTQPQIPALQPARRPRIASVGLVGLVVTAARGVPVVSDLGVPPPPALIQQAAQITAADGWALWNHIQQLIRTGELFPNCQGMFIDQMLPLTPSGGIGGWTWHLRIPLDGIPA